MYFLDIHPLVDLVFHIYDLDADPSRTNHIQKIFVEIGSSSPKKFRVKNEKTKK